MHFDIADERHTVSQTWHADGTIELFVEIDGVHHKLDPELVFTGVPGQVSVSQIRRRLRAQIKKLLRRR